jgi:FAD/FMN-containing dehydrogenase
VVLADGHFLRASATKSQDLFWTLRGGSGNLGVATSFEYQLHAVGPTILGGIVLYPWARPRRCSASTGSSVERRPLMN